MGRPLIFLLLVLSVVALSGAQKKRRKPGGGKIVGGYMTSISQHPHQASLEQNGRHICGASIITARHLLTAAHCVVDATPRELTARVGSSTSQSGGSVYAISSVQMHENYNSVTKDNDIAMLSLAIPIRTSSGARAAALLEQLPPPGSWITVTGWGATSEGGFGSTQLLGVDVPLISHANCNRMYMNTNRITENMFCCGVQGGGKDSCQGDSGGPAMYDGKLAGVVSWGSGCARAGSPGVYASIPRYLSWISRKVQS